MPLGRSCSTQSQRDPASCACHSSLRLDAGKSPKSGHAERRNTYNLEVASQAMFDAKTALVTSLDEMQSVSSHHDECTWVAGSGKAELYVRDRLGAILSKQFPELVVAREWGEKRHDLAVLTRDAHPIAVVEGKHLFDFDFFVPSICQSYRKSIRNDVVKMRESDASQQVVSLLMTSIRGEIPAHLSRVFKYGPGSNRFHKKHGPEATQVAVDAAPGFLAEFGSIVHSRQLSSGKFCGLEVCLWIWLVTVSR